MKKADAGPKPNPKPNSKSNRSILGITYVVVALFLGLAAYLGYFLQVKSEDVINNSYNARLDSFSDRIVRGRILASDGTVLAQTQMDGGGNETRVYPFGDIFDPVSYTHLRLAIVSEDVKALAKAPGIGNKTAQRLILDLKDKISMDDVLGNMAGGAGMGAADTGLSLIHI